MQKGNNVRVTSRLISRGKVRHVEGEGRKITVTSCWGLLQILLSRAAHQILVDSYVALTSSNSDKCFCVRTCGMGIVVLHFVQKIIVSKFVACSLEAIRTNAYLNIISYSELSLSFSVCLKNLWTLPEITSLPSTICAFLTSCLSYYTHTFIYSIKS